MSKTWSRFDSLDKQDDIRERQEVCEYADHFNNLRRFDADRQRATGSMLFDR